MSAQDLTVNTVGLTATGAGIGALTGFAREALAIKKLSKTAASVGDCVMITARDAARFADPKNCKKIATKAGAKYGALIGLAIAAGLAISNYLDKKFHKAA